MPQNISIDLVTLLLFTMPGFFLIWGFKPNKKSDFEYFIFSMFWGIIIMVLFYQIIPTTSLIPLLNNPLAGAIIFSLLAYEIGFLGRKIKSKFN